MMTKHSRLQSKVSMRIARALAQSLRMGSERLQRYVSSFEQKTENSCIPEWNLHDLPQVASDHTLALLVVVAHPWP